MSVKKMDSIFKTDFHVNKNYYLEDYILFFTEVVIRSSSESSRFQKESQILRKRWHSSWRVTGLQAHEALLNQLLKHLA